MAKRFAVAVVLGILSCSVLHQAVMGQGPEEVLGGLVVLTALERNNELINRLQDAESFAQLEDRLAEMGYVLLLEEASLAVFSEEVGVDERALLIPLLRDGEIASAVIFHNYSDNTPVEEGESFFFEIAEMADQTVRIEISDSSGAGAYMIRSPASDIIRIAISKPSGGGSGNGGDSGGSYWDCVANCLKNWWNQLTEDIESKACDKCFQGKWPVINCTACALKLDMSLLKCVFCKK